MPVEFKVQFGSKLKCYHADSFAYGDYTSEERAFSDDLLEAIKNVIKKHCGHYYHQQMIYIDDKPISHSPVQGTEAP